MIPIRGHPRDQLRSFNEAAGFLQIPPSIEAALFFFPSSFLANLSCPSVSIRASHSRRMSDGPRVEERDDAPARRQAGALRGLVTYSITPPSPPPLHPFLRSIINHD